MTESKVTEQLIRQILKLMKCPKARTQVLNASALKMRKQETLFWFLFG